jgi:hypothetical protein
LTQMKDELPEPIQKAIEAGVDLFMGENYEWKLEVEGRDEYIEKYAGAEICVIANNGFGDYLFLRRDSASGRLMPEIYEFQHEGPVIDTVDDDPYLLFELKPRPPSSGEPPRYATGETVKLGDRVELKLWFRRKRGEVVYVPGVSPCDLTFETGGLTSVVVRTDAGDEYAHLVMPETNTLQPSVRRL